MDELWYKSVTYEDAKDMVKESLANTVESFIASGYWLKYIRDSRAYEQDGHASLWAFAETELGLQTSEASRAMSMNDKYSVDGNSPVMLEKYKQYNKSQLQEMLTMTDEQREQVTPDMRIKEIRELKNPVSDDMEPGGVQDDDFKDHGADQVQNELEGWIEYFVYHKFMTFYRAFAVGGLESISIEVLRNAYGEELQEDSLPENLLLFDDHLELVDGSTGEIVGKYENDTVNTVLKCEFEKLRNQREVKIRPEIKGLMDDPYCCICGAPLNSPEAENVSLSCGQCGQAVDWSRYVKRFCDVATDDTVDAESEEESLEDILTEIEVMPEAEEPLNVEFDTEELLQELDTVIQESEDNVIDGEYREITEAPETIKPKEDVQPVNKVPNRCTTGWSKYLDSCSCCGYNGVQCCAQCEKGQTHNCNSRCGWVDDPYIPDEDDAGMEKETDDLFRLRSLLDKKKKELQEYLDVGDIPENTMYEKKTIVAALANMLCELEDMGFGNKTTEQPSLPAFKNNNERKAWIEDVEAWGLWYEDTNIEARYYKYDFSDGSRLIAVKYRYTCPPWLKDKTDWKDREDGSYTDTHYHMIFSAEYKKTHSFEYLEHYTHNTASVNSLIDFIKELQKRRDSE